jgi:hypothetical protein
MRVNSFLGSIAAASMLVSSAWSIEVDFEDPGMLSLPTMRILALSCHNSLYLIPPHPVILYSH